MSHSNNELQAESEHQLLVNAMFDIFVAFQSLFLFSAHLYFSHLLSITKRTTVPFLLFEGQILQRETLIIQSGGTESIIENRAGVLNMCE